MCIHLYLFYIHTRIYILIQSKLTFFFVFLFAQLYEINDDPKRKEFLDDLFSFMQKRGKYSQREGRDREGEGYSRGSGRWV